MDKNNEIKRCAEAPDNPIPIKSVEMRFAMPVYFTRDQERRLHDLVDEIVEHPCNQTEDGTHWLAGYGSKPLWNEPQEPDFDHDTLFMESTARPFVSEKERAKKQKAREKYGQRLEARARLNKAIKKWSELSERSRYRVVDFNQERADAADLLSRMLSVQENSEREAGHRDAHLACNELLESIQEVYG